MKPKTYPSNRGKPPKGEPARFKTKNIPLNATGYKMVPVEGKKGMWKQVKIETDETDTDTI